MKKPFRYFGNETPKEFRQSAFREILSGFYFSETAFGCGRYFVCKFGFLDVKLYLCKLKHGNSK